MNDQILKPVIDKLQQEGATEEQIASTLIDITQTVTMKLYQQAMEVFSEEDIQKIEDCPTDEGANKLIVSLYAQKEEKSPDELLEFFLKEFVKEFLTEQH